MKLIANPFIPEDGLFLMADLEHPEIHLGDDIGDVDGTVLVCHPKHETAVRDALAQLSEHYDVNALITGIRKGIEHGG